ncbi:MAG: dihydrolipoyl dehydrogenase family protein [Chitinophagaceae bacterium]
MKNKSTLYDMIVIGAGSGGLGMSLFLNKIGLKVLLIDKTDKNIGGDCLNYGCVPSKALIHLSRIIHDAKKAETLGLTLSGKLDINKVANYIDAKQNIIRRHENADYILQQGVDMILGTASFAGKNSIRVNDKIYTGKRIVLASGSHPRKLNIPGIEQVLYYDNESIFDLMHLPERWLVVGGGPIGMEIGQALNRLGSKVSVVQSGNRILPHDEESVTGILLEQLQKEGMQFIFNARPVKFVSPTEAIIQTKDNRIQSLHFDAVMAAVGRESHLDELDLPRAGIQVENHKIASNKFLRTTNKHVYVCGDIAGNLQFSHAAEQHVRLLLNNFLSPFKKRLDNSHMSWVTFTDPELATFGLNETRLQKGKRSFEKLEFNFDEDDRAVVDDYTYGKLILYISKKKVFGKTKILGGVMIAPHAGELIQELILMNTAGLSINKIFNKIYPYPVASRVNQHIIANYKSQQLTLLLIKILKKMYRLF